MRDKTPRDALRHWHWNNTGEKAFDSGGKLGLGDCIDLARCDDLDCGLKLCLQSFLKKFAV